MVIKQTSRETAATEFGGRAQAINVRAIRRMVWRVGGLVLLAIALGSSSIPAELAQRYAFSQAITSLRWDLVEWEVNALWEKLEAQVEKPADEVPPTVGPRLVQEYLERAGRIGQIEGELERRSSIGYDQTLAPSSAELTMELGGLREIQAETRARVEQLIERQIASQLSEAGFLGLGGVWPPVRFTFVEPPQKLVVSRRDEIETIYSKMLMAGMGLPVIEEVEGEINQQRYATAYITDIGGLGAFPTMVVDRASLQWVLSTVAHEWTHNYLVFYPLGWNYFASQDLTTMNETVAEIVGNEIGDYALAQYYPEEVIPDLPVVPEVLPETLPFDFRTEMRITRLEVDRLLAAGDVVAAEAYMEARRLEFIENGFPLRVLNQAYFAFHGSYGTSAASTSPIGPKMERLRDLMPDVKTFLETVRSFTSVEDLDQALIEWGAATEDVL